MNIVRTPTETAPGADGAAGATAGVSVARGQARRARRRHRGRGLEGGTAVGRRRDASRSMPRCRATNCGACRSIRRRAAIAIHPRALDGRTISPGAAIAVGAFADDEGAAAFAQAARAAGVPVNVIDKPAFCDFSFGAIVNRSPLVIGISTDGGAPMFAQAIRAKLEALLPIGFAAWAAAALRWRDAVKASGLSFAGAPPVLAGVHRACDHAPRRCAAAERLRALHRRGERRGRRGRARLGDVGRRRPRRSRTADAARRARAAGGRRHPVRRSGVARGARLRPPRGARRCWSARPASVPPASRRTSTR